MQVSFLSDLSIVDLQPSCMQLRPSQLVVDENLHSSLLQQHQCELPPLQQYVSPGTLSHDTSGTASIATARRPGAVLAFVSLASRMPKTWHQVLFFLPETMKPWNALQVSFLSDLSIVDLQPSCMQLRPSQLVVDENLHSALLHPAQEISPVSSHSA